MIGELSLFSALFAGVMLMTLLYYALILATEELETGQTGERSPGSGTESLYDRITKTADALRAVIHCASCPPAVPNRYEAMGYTDCNVLNLDFGGNLSCTNGCLGLGSCAKVCPNDAIVLRRGEIFVTDFCAGCGQCARVCPKRLIELIPVSGLKTIECAATGNNDSNSLCPVALDQNPYTIDYRKFRKTGFKILGK